MRKEVTESFVQELMKTRMKAELDPKSWKNIRDGFSHEYESRLQLSNDYDKMLFKRYDRLVKKYGRDSWQFTSHLRAGVGVEYGMAQIRDEYLKQNEIPPAYDLSLRAICHNEEVIDIFTNKKWGPNTKRFIKRMRHARDLYFKSLEPTVETLNNGSVTRWKFKYNMVDITGVIFSNKNFRYPKLIMSKLKIVHKEYWDSIDVTEYSRGAFGQHFMVPGPEGRMFREVYNMDPEVQLVSKPIARYLRFLTRWDDATATIDQQKWKRKCIVAEWYLWAIILSTDMEKYSDSLNRRKLIDILIDIGLFTREEGEELDYLWGLPVWDRDKKYLLIGSDSVLQGQYSIFDAMTLANEFAQCVIYDILKEDILYKEKIYNYSELERDINKCEVVTYGRERYRLRSKNSALGDDTVMTFLNEHEKNPLDVVKDVFSYLGVNISNSKTHTLNRGEGFIDFAKRVIDRNGVRSYISANAISKNNFDDYVMEYFKLVEEDEELAESFGNYFLKDKFDFVKSLHKINGGIRKDEITDDDLILFEYKINRISSLNKVRVNEVFKQLNWIREQGIMLSNTCLVGWLDDYDPDNDLYVPNEEDDGKIYAKILNYVEYGRNIYYEPSMLLGKIWDEVKNMDLFEEVMYTIKEDELLKKDEIKKSHIYEDMSNLCLSNYQHNLFIFQFSTTNPSGTRSYDDMRYSTICMKFHNTFSECVRRLNDPNIYIYTDTCYYCERTFLYYHGDIYRLYSVMRETYRTKEIIPKSIFAYICSSVFVNKDIDDIYDLFISSLPYLSRSNEYYNYFS